LLPSYEPESRPRDDLPGTFVHRKERTDGRFFWNSTVEPDAILASVSRHGGESRRSSLKLQLGTDIVGPPSARPLVRSSCERSPIRRLRRTTLAQSGSAVHGLGRPEGLAGARVRRQPDQSSGKSGSGPSAKLWAI